MLYFSGTGNSKYIAEMFSRNMDAVCHSIEEEIDFDKLINSNETIGFCYPIYASRVPRILREFVNKHIDALKSKKLIIFCTQLIFSGDGTRAFVGLLPRGHTQIIYSEHFYMPANTPNLKILPYILMNDKMIRRLCKKAEREMQDVCNNIKSGKIKKRGFCIGSRMAGLLQAWIVPLMEKSANMRKSIKISKACDNCGVCVARCPMKNLAIEDNAVKHKYNCTTCYRCVNKCPQKAITVVFHGKVKKQYKGMISIK